MRLQGRQQLRKTVAPGVRYEYCGGRYAWYAVRATRVTLQQQLGVGAARSLGQGLHNRLHNLRRGELGERERRVARGQTEGAICVLRRKGAQRMQRQAVAGHAELNCRHLGRRLAQAAITIPSAQFVLRNARATARVVGTGARRFGRPVREQK